MLARVYWETFVTRRDLVRYLAMLIVAYGQRALPLAERSYCGGSGLTVLKDLTGQTGEPAASAAERSALVFPDPTLAYHGYSLHDLTVDGCTAHVVRPKDSLPARPWVWRTMFWDAFPGVDVALLEAGFHVAFIDVGNTFGCPDAMKHFDAFYANMRLCGLSAKPALEGLSRGGLYAYRWAYANTDKVGCIYGDAPVCDMKSWPGGKGNGSGSPEDWKEAIKDYHFADEKEMLRFKGNPIDILEPIAAAHIPIIHVCGDADTVVPEDENTDIVRVRYIALGGDFALIVKQGCGHHPHGLADPSHVVNFIMAHCAEGEAAKKALASSPKPGSILELATGHW
jgi:pimeloyl-ACP methyl ester carboxylesterase